MPRWFETMSDFRSRSWIDRMVVGCVLLVTLCATLNVLLPTVVSSGEDALAIADGANLLRIHQWQVDYQAKQGVPPPAGGFRFVVAPWCDGVCEHTPANLDRFFTPGPAKCNDPSYAEAYHMLLAGEDPIPSLQGATSSSTHYAGPAVPKALPGCADEAVLADDNEGGWNLRSGTVHVVFGDGRLRRYEFLDLKANGWVETNFDKSVPVRTWGPSSPIPACRSLSNL